MTRRHKCAGNVRSRCGTSDRRRPRSFGPSWLRNMMATIVGISALGIGADRQWDAFFAAWRARVGQNWNTPGGRDIVWRSRAQSALPLLARMILDPTTSEADRTRYFRAFDFHTEPAKQTVLIGLLGGNHPQQAAINAMALAQLHGVVPNTPEVRAIVNETLDRYRGTEQFVDLVAAYGAPIARRNYWTLRFRIRRRRSASKPRI